MGEDEHAATTALGAVRAVFADAVPRHRGTLEVFVGDCFVALFGSAVDAVQAKDVAALAALHVERSDATREALERYCASARQLQVTMSDVDVLVEGDDALAAFDRKDDCVDAKSGQAMHLEVRLSSERTRVGGAWKLRGVKKS
jgi:ketosteroid isomerase-like protein